MKRKSILFIFSNYSSFVEADDKILSNVYHVRKYTFLLKKGAFNVVISLFKQLLFLIINFWKFDAVFIWFADYHAFLPVLFAKLFHKKSFVVIGGHDVNSLPEFNYGTFNNPIRKFFAKRIFLDATVCFSVAKALEIKLLTLCANARVETVPTIYDHERFNFEKFERTKTIVTLSTTDSYQRYMIKGLDRFCDLATHLLEFKFKIIGITPAAMNLFDPLPPNLELLPPVKHEEMRSQYETASFYVQLSRSEGLPNALCEAMLCGCIPIGTDVGDIKDTIENVGLVVEEWQPERAATFIKENHNNNELRINARNRIISRFDNKKRIIRFQKLFCG
jgi:glycosyltransferase involved in cell wall biosynthesis